MGQAKECCLLRSHLAPGRLLGLPCPLQPRAGKKLVNTENISGPEHPVLEKTDYDLSLCMGGRICDRHKAIDKWM